MTPQVRNDVIAIIGLILGTFLFAGAYEAIEPVLEAVPGPEAQTVPELLGLPTPVVLLMLLACLVGVGWMTRDKSATPQAASTAAPSAAAMQVR